MLSMSPRGNTLWIGRDGKKEVDRFISRSYHKTVPAYLVLTPGSICHGTIAFAKMLYEISNENILILGDYDNRCIPDGSHLKAYFMRRGILPLALITLPVVTQVGSSRFVSTLRTRVLQMARGINYRVKMDGTDKILDEALSGD